MSLSIALATEEMCIDLAKIKHRVWQSTYKNIYPKQTLDNFNIEHHANKFKNMILSKNLELFVAIVDDKIVGYTAIGKSPRRQNLDFFELVLLYVLQEFQGQGIGKKLFDFAKEKLYKLNQKHFMIYCNKYNTKAHNFYKKMGCKIIEIEPDNPDKSLPQIKFIYNF